MGVENYLSDDLIIQEILTKLPIKSILRFEAVSKHWYSTLSSSNFAISYLQKSPFYHPNAPVHTLFIMCGTKYYLFSYDDRRSCENIEDNLVKLDFDFGMGNASLDFVNCCNGLICLTTTSEEYFVLWNPATRKLHKYESRGYFDGFDMSRPFSAKGFGYSSYVDDYKYVSIFMPDSREEGASVHIFSVRENKWRKLDVDPEICLMLYGQGILLDGKLYWRGFNRKFKHAIISFDLGTEMFDVSMYICSQLSYLGVMGDCLCNFTDKKLDILKPPTILRSFSSPGDLESLCFPVAIGFMMNVAVIGFTTNGKYFSTRLFTDGVRRGQKVSLGLVDIDTETPQYTVLLRFENMIDIAAYVPSLVSPSPFA